MYVARQAAFRGHKQRQAFKRMQEHLKRTGPEMRAAVQLLHKMKLSVYIEELEREKVRRATCPAHMTQRVTG
eukprot:8303051-Pyramimonas_sp.AAC.1